MTPGHAARAGYVANETGPNLAACLAPRHGDPEPAQPGARLCRPCAASMTRDLRRLPVLYAGLTGLLDPRATGDGHGCGDGLPYNDAAAEAMSQIRHDLQVWTRQVITERRPAAWPLPQVPAMCGWLAGFAPWASFREWAGDMAGALAADRGRAAALLDPRPQVRITVPAALNRCPRCRAAGTLAAVVYTGDGDPRPSLVACGGCGHEWDTTQWLKLGRDIIRNAQAAALAAKGETEMCNPITTAHPDLLLAKGVHEDYEWEVTANRSGYRCGYVRVPQGHPWHGRDYDGVRAADGDYPDVHGGLTFAEADTDCGKGGEDNAWWLGFDCAHAGDAPDPELPGYHAWMAAMERGDVVRTTDYVAAECRKLAEQAAAAQRAAS